MLEFNRSTSHLGIHKFYHNLFLDLIGRLVVERFDVLKNRKTLVISCCLRSIIVVLLLFTNVAAKTYFRIIPSGIHDVGYIGMKGDYFLYSTSRFSYDGCFGINQWNECNDCV